MSALEAALSVTWAMEETALERLLTIADRQNFPDPSALEAYRAESAKNAERAMVREGVGIITANGPLFKRANMFAAMSGATSYEIMRRDFQTLIDDPKVKAIILNIDSPGGDANGISELSAAIFAARGKKPITAYVSGLGCSAGYWLASAADKIIISDTAVLGSIGAQIAFVDQEPRAGEKRYHFVSSVSPNKNAGPETETGAKAIQNIVNRMGEVFVEAVARNRGVDTQVVLKDFGKGGTFVGKDAVEAGLADGIGNFEAVFAELSAASKTAAPGGRSTRNNGVSMSEENGAPAAVQEPKADIGAAVAEALASERKRTSGLTRLANAHGVSQADLAKAIDDNLGVAEFALQIADGVTAKGNSKIESLKSDEEDAAQAVSQPANETETDDKAAAEALVKQIVGA